jgi:nucleoside-diphosphate-sugar epimerase
VTVVAVTGATGIYGRCLTALLEHEPAVDRVVGVARRPFNPAEHGLTKMTFRSADVLDLPALEEAFDGADVACHLAFTVFARGRDAARVRQTNVTGSRNAFAAAAAAGVRRLVYASSVAAYGAHPDNPVPIREDHAVRGNPGLYYADHKAEVELLLDRFEQEHPGIDVVRLRPCTTVGPASVDLYRGPLPAPFVGLLLSPLLRWPLPDPGVAPFQLVHEADVAEAFRLAIVRDDVRGAFNVAGGGTMTGADLAAALGAIRVPVPAGVVRRILATANRVGMLPLAHEWLRVTEHPIIVDTARARTELGWVPRYDTHTALVDMLQHYRASLPLAG